MLQWFSLQVRTLYTYPKLWLQISWEMLEHTWPTFKNTPNAQYWTSSSCILLLLSTFFFLVSLLHLCWSSFKNPDFKEKGIHPVIWEDVTILPSCIFNMENIVRHHLILFNETFSHCNGIKFSYFYDLMTQVFHCTCYLYIFKPSI